MTTKRLNFNQRLLLFTELKAFNGEPFLNWTETEKYFTGKLQFPVTRAQIQYLIKSSEVNIKIKDIVKRKKSTIADKINNLESRIEDLELAVKILERKANN